LHLHTCVYVVFNIFLLLPPFPATSPLSLVPIAPLTTAGPVSPSWSQFCRRKTKNDKMRNMVFFVLFPCICVLQLQLIHLLQASSLHPICFPWWFLPVWNFCIHYCTVSVSTLFKVLVSFSCPILPCTASP
jgi:hypothetical protein